MEVNVKGISRLENGNYTQLGAAERFLKYAGENYKFCTDTGVWMQYDEETCLWSEITEAEMIHIIVDLGKLIALDAINIDDNDRRQAALGFAGKFETKYFCSNALFFCQGIKDEDGEVVIPCKFDDFDSNPKIIGLTNGKAYE